MSVGVDFDFARWIAERRGAIEQQAREGSAYAFAGEYKYRRTLMAARPVAIAIEATTRAWRDKVRDELVGASLKISDAQFPRVYGLARKAGQAMRVRVPTVLAAPKGHGITVKALGMPDNPYLFVDQHLAEKLDDATLLFALGHELGHIQNGQVLYSTALHYLQHSAGLFVRWTVQPAVIALAAWARRAEITCDRAGLLAVGDLEKALLAMVRLSVPTDEAVTVDAAAILRDLPPPEQATRGLGKYTELLRGNPFMTKRVAALRWYAESGNYAVAVKADPSGKPSLVEVDARIADLISVF